MTHRSLLPFRSPMIAALSESTMTGKSTLMYKLLKYGDSMFETPPDKIVYAYTEYQPLFDELKRNIPNLVFFQGVLTTDDIDS